MKRMWSRRELKEVSAEEAKSVKKDIATLVDADGHDRFIEGEITFDEVTGLTQKYGKWSLSGSHLLIVVAGTIANGTSLTGPIAKVNLPQWIVDKIQVLYGNAAIRQTDTTYASDGSTTQTMLSVLAKISDAIDIRLFNITATADREFRVNFDLLIDQD